MGHFGPIRPIRPIRGRYPNEDKLARHPQREPDRAMWRTTSMAVITPTRTPFSSVTNSR